MFWFRNMQTYMLMGFATCFHANKLVAFLIARFMRVRFYHVEKSIIGTMVFVGIVEKWKHDKTWRI